MLKYVIGALFSIGLAEIYQNLKMFHVENLKNRNFYCFRNFPGDVLVVQTFE